ncbi:MAG: uL15m family ribosomal protein [Candidatus Spechtbacterales bacterium]|nr:uL15m family ribosomal protein [Candidatus Spechtbacterales bacterium]
MQVHNLKKPKNQKRKRRVGRGGARGTFSGRGVKGQKARAGARIRPEIWDYITKIPKLAGPTAKQGQPMGAQNQRPVFTVNLEDIQSVAKSGDVIDVEYLLKNNLVRKHKGKLPRVKVLAKGDIKKKVTLEGLEFSKSAREKVEEAGGEIK